MLRSVFVFVAVFLAGSPRAEVIDSGGGAGPCNSAGVCSVDLSRSDGTATTIYNSTGLNFGGMSIIVTDPASHRVFIRTNDANTTPTVRIEDSEGFDTVKLAQGGPSRTDGGNIQLTDYTGTGFEATWGMLPGLETSFITTHAVLRIGGASATTGAVQIGTLGTPISHSIRGTTVNDIAAVAANACNADIAVTVTGAATGAECIVGMPATTPALLQGTCFVSAVDTVQLRICNGTGAASADPASATYSVRVFNP